MTEKFNIFLDGYFSNNFGDDLMFKGVASIYDKCTFHAISNKSEVKESFKEYSNVVFHSDFSEISELDLYLFLGGSIYQFLKLKNILFHSRRLYRLNSMRNREIPIISLGCNVGPINHKIGKVFINRELNSQFAISVRDQASFEYLTAAKIKKDIILNKSPDIGFEILDLVTTDYTERKNNILGLSIMEQSEPLNESIIYAITDHLNKKESNIVYLFAFDQLEGKDKKECINIKKSVGRSFTDRLKIIEYDGDLRNFVNIFRECDFIVGQRFHSIILAHHYKIPYFPICYSNKSDEFIRDVGFPFPKINSDELKKLTSNFKLSLNTFKSSEYNFPLPNGELKHLQVMEKFVKNSRDIDA